MPALYHKAAEEALTLCEIPYLSGSIPWFFTAELFTQGPRSAAVSVGVLVNWAANAVVGISYPFLEVLYFIDTPSHHLSLLSGLAVF